MAFTRLLEALAAGRAFDLYGDGSVSRGFTYVADVVDATLAAMERGRPGRVYNVGGATEATMREVIELAEQVAGRRLEVVRREPAGGDPRRTAADTTLIRRELAWEPSVALERGLRAHWEWASTRVGAR